MLSVIGFCTVGFFLLSTTKDIPHLDRKRRTILTPWAEETVGSFFCRMLIEQHIPNIVDPNHPMVQHLTSVGNHITDSNQLPRYKYILIDDPTLNAFVLPGNCVFIYTGILDVFQNQSGAAMVISHELSHCLAGHSIDGMVMSLPLAFLSYVTGSWMSLFLSLFVSLPKSRSDEIEADTIGVHLMTRACFDPRETHGVMERLANAAGEGLESDSDDLFSTHPSTKHRIDLIKDTVQRSAVVENCEACGRMDWNYPSHNFISTYKRPERFPRISKEQAEALLQSI